MSALPLVCQSEDQLLPSVFDHHYAVMDQVISVVARAHGFSAPELLQKRRHEDVSHPRQLCMYLLRSAGFSLIGIGRRLGLDHGTVLHGYKAVRNQMDCCPGTKKTVTLWEAHIADKLGIPMGRFRLRSMMICPPPENE